MTGSITTGLALNSFRRCRIILYFRIQLTKFKSITNDPVSRQIIAIVLFGFLLRMILLPSSQVVDADAVSRIFLSRQWLDDPTFIYEGVWLPLHQYWSAVLIAISGSYITFPIVVNCLLASLIAWPVYNWAKREFNSKTAFWVALLFTISPVIFRNSFQALSGTPFLLLVAFAFNELSRLLQPHDSKHAYRMGTFLTIAAGFRYEAWLLIAVFGLILVFKKQWKNAFKFSAIAVIFPLFWFIGNAVAHGHPLYGIPGIYNDDVVAQLKAVIPRDVEIMRLIFYPLAYFFVVTPVFLLLGGLSLFRKQDNLKVSWIWIFPIMIFFPLMVSQAVSGTLVLQYRFVGLLLLLSVPFLSWIISNYWNKKGVRWLMIATIFLQIPLSCAWMKIPIEKVFPKKSSTYFAVRNFRWQSDWEISAIPRLKTQKFESLKDKIKNTVNEDGGLILDFISWDVSYNLALHSSVHPDNCYIIPPGEDAFIDLQQLEKIFNETDHGVLLLNLGSPLDRQLKKINLEFHLKKLLNRSLEVNEINSPKGTKCFKYRVF